MNVLEFSCAIIWLHYSTTFAATTARLLWSDSRATGGGRPPMGRLRGWRDVCRASRPAGHRAGRPGSPVGENGAEWIAAFHGCIARGVLAVPLDAYGTAEFAARVASDVQPKLAVGDALLLHQLPSEYSRLTFEDWLSALPAEEAGPVAGLSRETPLQILFTSGTTAIPRAWC